MVPSAEVCVCVGGLVLNKWSFFTGTADIGVSVHLRVELQTV